MIHIIFRFLIFVSLVFASAAFNFGQTAVKETPRKLTLGTQIKGELDKGETKTFALHLEKHQFAVLVLRQKMFQAKLAVDDANSGKNLIIFNGDDIDFGYERLFFLSDDAPRDLLIRVLPSWDAGAGKFTLTLAELRAADAADAEKFTAQSLMLKGYRLNLENKSDSLPKAHAVFEDALKIARQSGDRTLETMILMGLHKVSMNEGKFVTADGYADAALALLAENDNDYAREIINNIVPYTPRHADGRPQDEILKKTIIKARESGESKLEILALDRLSGLYYGSGDVLKGIQYGEEAVAAAQKSGNKNLQANTLLTLSNSYYVYADFLKTREIINSAMPIAEDSAPDIIPYLYAIRARIAENLGNIQEAIDYDLKTLELLIQYGGNQYSVAQSLMHVSRDYMILGQNNRALEYNLQGAKLFAEIDPNNSSVDKYRATGAIYLFQKDFGKARENFIEALKVFNGGTLPVRRRTAANLTSAERSYLNSMYPLQLARIYFDLGRAERGLNRPDKAIEDFLEAAQIWSDIKVKQSETGALNEAADLYIALKQFDKASQLAAQVLVKSRLIGDRAAESFALYTLARAQRANSDLPKALQLISDSLTIIESLRSQIISPENRAGFLSTVSNEYDFYIELLIELQNKTESKGLGADAFAASERARSRGLLDLLAESYVDVSAGISPELKMREQSINATLSALQTQLIKLKSAEKQDAGKIADLRKRIEQADGEREQLDSQIRRSNPRYAALKYPTTIDLKQTQAMLDEKTVLLEYQIGDDASFLFAVGKNDFQIVKLPNEKTLRDSIKSLRSGITAPTRTALGNYLTGRRELYKILLAPVENLLKGKSKIIVAADGALNYLPFEVLLRSEQETGLDKLSYLVRDFDIFYTPSASVLANLQSGGNNQTAKPMKSFLAFAAPDYAAKTDERNTLARRTRDLYGEKNVWKLIDLPNTKIEVGEIARLFPAGQATVLEGAQASEKQVKAEGFLSRYRYLHFAVHGLVDEQKPQFSSLVLSLPKAGEQAKSDNQSKDLNPQSENEEDGLLQTSEIFNLRLNADLVTLSACETGLGQELRGEGIIGLTRAFFYAGTPSVLESLWKVDDASTAELMTAFYASLNKNGGRDKASALREAQLKLIKGNRYAHPYYWAAFVLQGRTDSLIKQK